jgi:hypothetical protein
VLHTITKRQICACRKVDIKREIFNYERLKTHFEENPADLKVLKHDEFLMPAKVQRSLRVIPDYLGEQIKRQQHPLARKIRLAKLDAAQTGNQLAKLDAINQALKRYKHKKAHGPKKYRKQQILLLVPFVS